MKFLLLFLISLPAHAPVVEWTLVPTFKEVNLCLRECPLKAYFVTEYRWEPRSRNKETVMEEYTVEIAVATRHPLKIEDLEDVAAIGGAAGGNPGGRRLETTLTVKAESFGHAAARAVETITSIVAGRVVALNVMTTTEHDARIEARADAIDAARSEGGKP